MKEVDCWSRIKLCFESPHVPAGCPQELMLVAFDWHRGSSTDVFFQGLPYKREEAWCHVACDDFDLAKITRSCKSTKFYFGCIENGEFVHGNAIEHDTVRFSRTVFVQKENGRAIFVMTTCDLIPAKIITSSDVPAGWSRFVKSAPQVHDSKFDDNVRKYAKLFKDAATEFVLGKTKDRSGKFIHEYGQYTEKKLRQHYATVTGIAP